MADLIFASAPDVFQDSSWVDWTERSGFVNAFVAMVPWRLGIIAEANWLDEVSSFVPCQGLGVGFPNSFPLGSPKPATLTPKPIKP